MHRFKNILAYVDVSRGKSDALDRAEKLARRNGADLTVVDVVEEIPAYLRPFIDDEAHGQEQDDRLRALTSWLRGEPVRAIAKVLHGSPMIALVREVIRGGHDLLIKDAHVEEGVVDLLFGRVDMRLLRNCPCPVWLVKPGHRRPFQRVLAAIDPQPSYEDEQLNAKIISLSSSMEKIEGSKVYVVSAWRGMAETAYVGDWHQDVMQKNEDEICEAARRTLEVVLKSSEVDLQPEQVHFEQGYPGEMISRVAKNINADLIVMGTIARGGISGLLIGNTAERVLRQVNCSVLTLKPDNFLSPIELDD